MCGIVGVIGQKPAKDILLDGLAKLEYRGYDSTGIAVLDQGLTVREICRQISKFKRKN